LLGVKWKDVDWLNASLNIERGVVKQIVDDVKTDSSRKSLTIDQALLAALKVWKQTTQFPANEDWIFASPLKLGRLPYSYTGFLRELQRAANKAGIGHLGTQSFRHTFRSWLDAVGTPIAVQQKADAPQRHQNDNEHIRRRGHRRDGAGTLEGSGAGTGSSGLTDCKLIAGPAKPLKEWLLR